jgi:DNA-binding MarR family transcriptional regulator
MAGAASVIPLLSSWEAYVAAEPDGDLPGFARWVLAAGEAEQQSGTPIRAGSSLNKAADSSDDAAGSSDKAALSPLLITRLFHVLQLLSKPVAKELGFTKPIEFQLLVQIALLKRPNKKELCRELLIEGSTGVEITKRLALRGFIREETDQDDRRSARLSLTEKGQKAIVEGYARLGDIHADFLSPLSSAQKRELNLLLSQLNDYHTRQLPANGPA